MSEKELIKKHNKGEITLLYNNDYSKDKYLIRLEKNGWAYLTPNKKTVLFLTPATEIEDSQIELLEYAIEEEDTIEKMLQLVGCSSMYKVERTQDYKEFLLQMSAPDLLKASEDVLAYIEEKENDFKALNEELPINVKYIKETLNKAIKKAKGE